MEKVKELLDYDKKKMTNELRKAFAESKKEPIFREFVESLPCSEDVLMKYRTDLEESSKEFDHCKHCKSILACKNKIEGYAYLPKISGNNLTFSYVECKRKIKLEKENEYLKYINLYYTKDNLKDACFKNIYKDDKERLEVIKYLVSFVNNYGKKEQKGLYLHGSFGCGKTYLIASTFHELAKNKISSAIVFWPEFLRDLKASFSSDFKEKFDEIKKVEVLLIDDIGAESTTLWGRDEILCPLVQYRMEEHKPTFFTSNLDYEMLEKHLETSSGKVDEVKARRVIERIKQLTVEQKMISQNLRK